MPLTPRLPREHRKTFTTSAARLYVTQTKLQQNHAWSKERAHEYHHLYAREFKRELLLEQLYCSILVLKRETNNTSCEKRNSESGTNVFLHWD